MKKWLNIKNNLAAPLFMVFLIAAWELITTTMAVPEYILPSPSVIAIALNENFSLLVEHSRITIVAVLGGAILAMTLALVLALAMDRGQSHGQNGSP
ncbi:MAG: hypothetical protein R6U08_07255 [Bacillota bacterium]